MVEATLSVVTRVIESLVSVKTINLLHLIFSEGPVEYVDVLSEARLGCSLRDDSCASLDSPSKADLGRSLGVPSSNFFDKGEFSDSVSLLS